MFVQRGGTRTVEFELDKRAFAYYNAQIKDWHVESGTYKIQIGASSRDIRCEREIHVTSKMPEVMAPDYSEKAPQYYNLDSQTKIFDRKQFEVVYDSKILEENDPKKGEFDLNSNVEDVRRGNLFGKAFYQIMKLSIKKRNKLETQEEMKKMNEVMMMEMPLRTVATFSLGRITIEQMEALLLLMNGHFFKGIFRAIKAKKRKKDLAFL